MKDKVVERLAKLTASPLETEEQLVYALTLVRKLLDCDAPSREYDSIRFFCDWALHIRIERHSGGRFLMYFDSEIPTLLAGKPIRKRSEDAFTYIHGSTEPRMIKVLQLVSFVFKFGWFLHKHNVKAHNDWTGKMLGIYLNVVSECPVVYNKKTIPLKHIDSLMVKRVGAEQYVWELAKTGTMVYRWELDLNRFNEYLGFPAELNNQEHSSPAQHPPSSSQQTPVSGSLGYRVRKTKDVPPPEKGQQ